MKRNKDEKNSLGCDHHHNKTNPHQDLPHSLQCALHDNGAKNSLTQLFENGHDEFL